MSYFGYTRPVTSVITFGMKQTIKIEEITITERATRCSFDVAESVADCFVASFRHAKFCLSWTTRMLVVTTTMTKQKQEEPEKEQMK